MNLGELSATYESNGDPASVSSGNGDLGGRSYGMYQFASNAGVVDAFVQWIKEQPTPLNHYGIVLEQSGTVNSDSFVEKWQELGKAAPVDFGRLQHDYTKQVYYNQAVDTLNANFGLDVTSRSEALQQVVWSRAVQYSAGNMCELFSAASELAGEALSSISDHDLIYYIYEYLIDDGNQAYQLDNGSWHSPNDWINGSRDVVDGLLNRFNNERDQALALL